MQKELGERRGNWVTTLQEYDLEFKLDTIIKGQGICMLMVVSKNNWEKEEEIGLQLCKNMT